MATSNVIAFPIKRRLQPAPMPIFGGNLYFSKAAELILSRVGRGVAALRVNEVGDLVVIGDECEFFTEAVTASGFACICSSDSDPARIAERLRAAHLGVLADLTCAEGA